MPDLTNNRFAENPINLDIQRSVFNMPHSVKFTGNVGDVIPFELLEVLPGDTFTVDTAKVVRMQPLVAPIMDDVYLDTYYFFVPTRLLWSHWKEFWGENTTGPWYPQVEYTVPQLQIPVGGFDVGTIADYLGIPPKAGAGKKVSALPFRAYAKICEDWMRDENLMNPINISIGDSDVVGVNTGDQVTDIQLGGKPFIACKYFDYFTACLPGAQKAAGPSVEFALRGLLPVNAYYGKETISNGDSAGDLDTMTLINLQHGGTATTPTFAGVGVSNYGVALDMTGTTAGNQRFSPNNLFANLDNINVFDINSLRQAFAIQRYYEKLARGGSRYIEFIKSFFNVDSPDARLQRSEYLGGSRLPLNVSQVEQTSATEQTTTPQGNLTGISQTGENHSDFTKSFTEHGYIIGVCVARYHHSYQQSVDRTFFRKTKFDYYNPTFANLGEQGVFEKEIYFDNTDLLQDTPNVFGYQEAWADYRYKPNRIAGEMRSAATTPLDMWHLGDNYASVPYLSDAWIREDKTMLDRCLAVTSAVSNQLIFDFYIQIKAARPMPLYSIPGLIDHH